MDHRLHRDTGRSLSRSGQGATPPPAAFLSPGPGGTYLIESALKRSLSFWFLLLVLTSLVAAQVPDTLHVMRADTLRADSLLQDSLQPDSVRLDSAASDRGGVDTLVHYSSQYIDFDVQNRITVLTGTAVITYKDMQLEAERIEVNWDKQLLTASGVTDTALHIDSGAVVIDSIYMHGRPHFVQSNEDFYGDEIAYNMKLKLGRVRGGTTTFEDGFYYGQQFKRLPDNVITVAGGNFTTCDKPSPDYHFAAKTLKVKVGKRVIARPVVLYFEDVPVMAAPYGIFPQQHGRTSGILIPTFGESGGQGRFLKDLGYYWATPLVSRLGAFQLSSLGEGGLLRHGLALRLPHPAPSLRTSCTSPAWENEPVGTAHPTELRLMQVLVHV